MPHALLLSIQEKPHDAPRTGGLTRAAASAVRPASRGRTHPLPCHILHTANATNRAGPGHNHTVGVDALVAPARRRRKRKQTLC